MALGSLYPFSRNHYTPLGNEDYKWKYQEPWAFDGQIIDVSKKMLTMRYTLIPYLYTLFRKTSVEGGANVWRPLFFEFPGDENTATIDEQFMIGSHILVTPVLTEGATR